jgi:predicted alpha/beta-hydrolase family hydrolase
VTSGETVSRASGPGEPAQVTGVVVVAHGGRSVSEQATSATQLAVIRMIPIGHAIRQAVQDGGAEVIRPRFALRGWNGSQASPVGDFRRILDDVGDQFGEVPIVLVGHSMGARAALRVAGHPLVRSVAGLAPWLPPGEPVDQLAGRWVLVAHGTADRITSPADTWAFAGRAASVTDVTAVEVRNGEHAMLRRAQLWHHIAAEFARISLHLPVTAGEAGPDLSQVTGAAGRLAL